jgi:hypothetical protein
LNILQIFAHHFGSIFVKVSKAPIFNLVVIGVGGDVAQLVESLPMNPKVMGSNLRAYMCFIKVLFILIAGWEKC